MLDHVRPTVNEDKWEVMDGLRGGQIIKKDE